MKPQLTVYMRSGCSLCEDMWQELEALPERERFELVAVDVDSDADLVQRYGTRVPVLRTADGDICYYFLDRDALRRYFENL